MSYPRYSIKIPKAASKDKGSAFSFLLVKLEAISPSTNVPFSSGEENLGQVLERKEIIHVLRKLYGAPGWLSQLSVRLLILVRS